MTTNSPNNSKAERMRAAYAKFQGKLQDLRRSRLNTLRDIFKRLDDQRLQEAKKNLDQE